MCGHVLRNTNSQMPPTLQTTTILAEFVSTQQRWSCYPASVKIGHLPGNSSRQLGQFGARATQKIALRYNVSVGRSEKLLGPVPTTAPWSTGIHVSTQMSPVLSNHFQLLPS